MDLTITNTQVQLTEYLPLSYSKLEVYKETLKIYLFTYKLLILDKEIQIIYNLYIHQLEEEDSNF